MKTAVHPIHGFAVNDQDFKKSKWSKNNPQTCVMVAITSRGVAVRDSKDKRKATQFYNHGEWQAFIQGAKAGQFDLPQAP